MEITKHDQQNLRKYLLGSLSEEKQQALEERLFTDDGYFEELQVIEDELTDQYLERTLSPEEQQSFEQHFLRAPARRQKLRFASSLKQYIAESGPEESSQAEPAPEKKLSLFEGLFGNRIASIALAAALLLIVAGISWVGLRTLRSNVPGQAPGGGVLAVSITPGLTRDGGELTKVKIPQGTGTLRLRVPLRGDDYNNYRAQLLTGEREKVWETTDLKASTDNQGSFISVDVPSSLLPPNDYQLKIQGSTADSGPEDIGNYPFRVVR
jgi:hypothetical protein